MLSRFLGILPILNPPLCALALSCDKGPIMGTLAMNLKSELQMKTSSPLSILNSDLAT
jgi:hypothetical protein